MLSFIRFICLVLMANKFALFSNGHGFDCRKAGSECLNTANCTQVDPAKTNQSHTVFNCDCPPGYTGNRCELTSKKCDSINCLNRGQCVQNLRTLKLACFCNCSPKDILNYFQLNSIEYNFNKIKTSWLLRGKLRHDKLMPE